MLYHAGVFCALFRLSMSPLGLFFYFSNNGCAPFIDKRNF